MTNIARVACFTLPALARGGGGAGPGAADESF
jgi:hypothetical protein